LDSFDKKPVYLKQITFLKIFHDEKGATFPDHFGDYTSISIIKVDTKFCDSLSEYLSNEGFKEFTNQTIISDNTLKNYNDGYVKKSYNIVLSGKEFTVDFLSDNETIIVERASW